MAEHFVGQWVSESTENFDAYMKALDVNLVLRKAGQMSTTTMYVSTEGNKINWKYKIAFKTGDLQFQLGEPFPETTPDGRKVTSTVTLDGDALVWLQEGKPCNTTVRRTVEEDGDLIVEICTAKDIICKRTYRRVKS